jgi:hypothetical protein
MNADAHVQAWEIDGLAYVLNNVDHIKAHIDNASGFSSRVPCVLINNSNTDITVPNGVELENIVFQALFVEFREEISKHIDNSFRCYTA